MFRLSYIRLDLSQTMTITTIHCRTEWTTNLSFVFSYKNIDIGKKIKPKPSPRKEQKSF